MKESIVLQNVFGTIGTVFWTIQVIPQVWKSWHEKSTEGLSPWLLVCWNISNALYGVYAIAEKFNIPLLLQPQTYAFLVTVSLCQCMYYGRKWSLWKVWAFGILILAIIGGFQAGFAYALQPSLHKGDHRPALAIAILNGTFVFSGFIPQYIEIIKSREVKGISLHFMFIDALGGLFSLLSLLFQPPLKVVTLITYVIIIICDSGIILCAYILNPIAEQRQQHEKEIKSQESKVNNG